MQQRELTTKQRIIESVSSVLFSLRFILVGFLVALLLFVVIYLIAGEIRSDRIERSTIVVERIERDFDAWLLLDSEEEQQSLAVDLYQRLEDLISKYPRLYATQRALFVRARLYYANSEWEASRESFAEVADRFPTSYLAPVALMSAASAMESDERPEEAITLLIRVADQFDSPEAPEALFNLGRLNEEINDAEAAIGYYERLLDEHPASGWTSIAQSRIIEMKIDRS